MVRITNIGRDTNAIWCNYFPEGQPPSGFIKIDIKSQEVVQHKVSGSETYAYHVILRLSELQEAETLPKATTAIWY